MNVFSPENEKCEDDGDPAVKGYGGASIACGMISIQCAPLTKVSSLSFSSGLEVTLS